MSRRMRAQSATTSSFNATIESRRRSRWMNELAPAMDDSEWNLQTLGIPARLSQFKVVDTIVPREGNGNAQLFVVEKEFPDVGERKLVCKQTVINARTAALDRFHTEAGKESQHQLYWNHWNICTIRGCWTNDVHYYDAEYKLREPQQDDLMDVRLLDAADGSLDMVCFPASAVNTAKFCSLQHVFDVVWGCAWALKYLHRNDTHGSRNGYVSHGALRLPNVVYTYYEDESRYRCRLINAKQPRIRTLHAECMRDRKSGVILSRAEFVHIPPNWNQTYDPHLDMYMLGICIGEMVTGTPASEAFAAHAGSPDVGTHEEIRGKTEMLRQLVEEVNAIDPAMAALVHFLTRISGKSTRNNVEAADLLALCVRMSEPCTLPCNLQMAPRYDFHGLTDAYVARILLTLSLATPAEYFGRVLNGMSFHSIAELLPCTENSTLPLMAAVSAETRPMRVDVKKPVRTLYICLPYTDAIHTILTSAAPYVWPTNGDCKSRKFEDCRVLRGYSMLLEFLPLGQIVDCLFNGFLAGSECEFRVVFCGYMVTATVALLGAVKALELLQTRFKQANVEPPEGLAQYIKVVGFGTCPGTNEEFNSYVNELGLPVYNYYSRDEASFVRLLVTHQTWTQQCAIASHLNELKSMKVNDSNCADSTDGEFDGSEDIFTDWQRPGYMKSISSASNSLPSYLQELTDIEQFLIQLYRALTYEKVSKARVETEVDVVASRMLSFFKREEFSTADIHPNVPGVLFLHHKFIFKYDAVPVQQGPTNSVGLAYVLGSLQDRFLDEYPILDLSYTPVALAQHRNTALLPITTESLPSFKEHWDICLQSKHNPEIVFNDWRQRAQQFSSSERRMDDMVGMRSAKFGTALLPRFHEERDDVIELGAERCFGRLVSGADSGATGRPGVLNRLQVSLEGDGMCQVSAVRVHSRAWKRSSKQWYTASQRGSKIVFLMNNIDKLGIRPGDTIDVTFRYNWMHMTDHGEVAPLTRKKKIRIPLHMARDEASPKEIAVSQMSLRVLLLSSSMDLLQARCQDTLCANEFQFPHSPSNMVPQGEMARGNMKRKLEHVNYSKGEAWRWADDLRNVVHSLYRVCRSPTLYRCQGLKRALREHTDVANLLAVPLEGWEIANLYRVFHGSDFFPWMKVFSKWRLRERFHKTLREAGEIHVGRSYPDEHGQAHPAKLDDAHLPDRPSNLAGNTIHVKRFKRNPSPEWDPFDHACSSLAVCSDEWEPKKSDDMTDLKGCMLALVPWIMDIVSRLGSSDTREAIASKFKRNVWIPIRRFFAKQFHSRPGEEESLSASLKFEEIYLSTLQLVAELFGLNPEGRCFPDTPMHFERLLVREVLSKCNPKSSVQYCKDILDANEVNAITTQLWTGENDTSSIISWYPVTMFLGAVWCIYDLRLQMQQNISIGVVGNNQQGKSTLLSAMGLPRTERTPIVVQYGSEYAEKRFLDFPGINQTNAMDYFKYFFGFADAFVLVKKCHTLNSVKDNEPLAALMCLNRQVLLCANAADDWLVREAPGNAKKPTRPHPWGPFGSYGNRNRQAMGSVRSKSSLYRGDDSDDDDSDDESPEDFLSEEELRIFIRRELRRGLEGDHDEDASSDDEGPTALGPALHLNGIDIQGHYDMGLSPYVRLQPSVFRTTELAPHLQCASQQAGVWSGADVGLWISHVFSKLASHCCTFPLTTNAAQVTQHDYDWSGDTAVDLRKLLTSTWKPGMKSKPEHYLPNLVDSIISSLTGVIHRHTLPSKAEFVGEIYSHIEKKYERPIRVTVKNKSHLVVDIRCTVSHLKYRLEEMARCVIMGSDAIHPNVPVATSCESFFTSESVVESTIETAPGLSYLYYLKADDTGDACDPKIHSSIESCPSYGTLLKVVPVHQSDVPDYWSGIFLIPAFAFVHQYVLMPSRILDLSVLRMDQSSPILEGMDMRKYVNPDKGNATVTMIFNEAPKRTLLDTLAGLHSSHGDNLLRWTIVEQIAFAIYDMSRANYTTGSLSLQGVLFDSNEQKVKFVDVLPSSVVPLCTYMYTVGELRPPEMVPPEHSGDSMSVMEYQKRYGTRFLTWVLAAFTLKVLLCPYGAKDYQMDPRWEGFPLASDRQRSIDNLVADCDKRYDGFGTRVISAGLRVEAFDRPPLHTFLRQLRLYIHEHVPEFGRQEPNAKGEPQMYQSMNRTGKQ